MVPSNADAVDRTPATPPSVNTTADVNALKDRETPLQPAPSEQNLLVEESSAPISPEAKDLTELVKNGASAEASPNDGQDRARDPADATNVPVQNGIHTLDQMPVKQSPERKSKRLEGSQHPERGSGVGNGQKQRKVNDVGDQHMNDSLHSYQHEDDDEMDATPQYSDVKYKRLKRKLKEVLEENERLSVALERSNRRARSLRQEKNVLLDRLCSYDRDSDSSIDTISTLSSDSESSDSSVNSAAYRSRKSSPVRTAVPAAATKHLQVPGIKKDKTGEPSASQTVHHPKKTAAKAAGRRSPAVSGRKEEKPVSIPSTITNVGSATQKPKRLHNTSKLKPILSKVRRVQPIERDEAGNVKLPVTVGIITIMSLGYVIYDREAFHNERYIWPVGYKMSRTYNSMIDPTRLTTYTCSVIEDGEAPKFQIDAEDQPGKPIIAGTATGAWTHIVKTANSIRKRDHSNSASGPDYFGFSNATIAKMIQDLPNAGKCKSYIMQRFEEPSAKSSSALEKRKASSAGGSKANKGGGGGSGGGGGDEGQGDQEEDEEGEGNDTYASLGTPGKKMKRSSSPLIRNASLGYGAKRGDDVEMEEAEDDNDDVDELDRLDDEETQSEGETSLSAGTDKADASEDSPHSTTGPSIVITSADNPQAGSGKDQSPFEESDMEMEGVSEPKTTQAGV
ncbi:hypothetical protein B0O80DRAFT_18142 [Mortierella sp. GBAus27b]|nr:hypothetical protein BGX31_002340 [Mortierella sp. GBA43]KAI8363625.1 hypothetical protein B0O80DRAFT_18142 [Mortierella sp. GBAus27b]